MTASTAAAARWVEVTPSPFSHEAEGLGEIRALMPNAPPFRAWSNVEFRDDQGRWHEVDLLLLGRRQLHLIELKYYAGDLRGDDLTWLRDGHRPEDSPLRLARRKAQRLKSRLRDELLRWAQETGAPPLDRGAALGAGGRLPPPPRDAVPAPARLPGRPLRTGGEAAHHRAGGD